MLRHTPRTSHNAKAFWCKSLEEKRKRLRRMLLKDPMNPDIPGTRKQYRKAIAEAKLTGNGKALQEETDPECFRPVKARQTRHPIPAPRKTDGSTAAEHQHMAQEFQDALYLKEHHRAKTDIQADADPLNMVILNAAIKQSPNVASPGPDFITTRLIKEFSQTREDLFLATMNRAWRQGIRKAGRQATPS